jgi:mono/diheme cytochrome c family protein
VTYWVKMLSDIEVLDEPDDNCHSADMVLHQPALTASQWRATIHKMRTAYGAPLPAEQVDALTTYLSRLPLDGDASAVARTNLVAAGAQLAGGGGSDIFAARCAACHQAGGSGVPGVFPPLNGSNWVNGPGATLVQILLHGIQGTLTVNGIEYNGAMPAFGGQLSDSEIAAVLSYVRGQWANRAGPVQAALVTTERAAAAGRNDPWNGDKDLARQ